MTDINELVKRLDEGANNSWNNPFERKAMRDAKEALESQQQEIDKLHESCAEMRHRYSAKCERIEQLEAENAQKMDALMQAQQEIERLTADRRNLYEDRATILKSQQAKFAQADQRIEQLESVVSAVESAVFILVSGEIRMAQVEWDKIVDATVSAALQAEETDNPCAAGHDFRDIGQGGTARCRDCGELADCAETGAALQAKETDNDPWDEWNDFGPDGREDSP